MGEGSRRGAGGEQTRERNLKGFYPSQEERKQHWRGSGGPSGTQHFKSQPHHLLHHHGPVTSSLGPDSQPLQWRQAVRSSPKRGVGKVLPRCKAPNALFPGPSPEVAPLPTSTGSSQADSLVRRGSESVLGAELRRLPLASRWSPGLVPSAEYPFPPGCLLNGRYTCLMRCGCQPQARLRFLRNGEDKTRSPERTAGFPMGSSCLVCRSSKGRGGKRKGKRALFP